MFGPLQKVLALLALAVLTCAGAHASEPCPDTRLDAEWSTRCFETHANQRRVKQAYKRKLHFDRSGFVTIRIKDPVELVAVNSQAVVTIPGIWFWGDYDYPNTTGGISRFSVASSTRSQKCGYFNDTTFAVIVPAIYDHCTSFIGTEATACNGCTRYCTDTDCHDSRLLGGDSSMTFDSKGKLLTKQKAGTLEDVCAGGPPTTWKEGNQWHLKCPPAPDSPFGD